MVLPLNISCNDHYAVANAHGIDNILMSLQEGSGEVLGADQHAPRRQ